jgi:ribosomal protein S18 acetylase RimI-like enzyme
MAGFAAATHGKGLGTVDFACLIPGFQGREHARAMLAMLLEELAKGGHERILFQVESKDHAAAELCRDHGFRPDPDLFINVYDR